MAKTRSNGLTERLGWLENRLQFLIEGSLARLFPENMLQNRLAHRLVEAMHAGAQTDSAGSWVAPNNYMIFVSAKNAAVLRGNTNLLDHMAAGLFDAGQEAGFSFSDRPIISVHAQPGLSNRESRVQADHRTSQVEDTAGYPSAPMKTGSDVPTEAFLIVDGTRVFSLVGPVVNIGRSMDNHLIIQDSRIAFHHAQIRAIHGRFVLFEVGTAGNIQVNGQAATQVTLQPGDVVTIGGIPLVYGQEVPPQSDTQAYNPQRQPGEE